MNRYRLFSHFAVINITGAGFMLIAYLNGWIARVIEADSSYVSFVILGLFIFGLLSAGYRILHISNELDRVCNTPHSDKPVSIDGNAARALEIRLFSRVSHIRTIGNALVVLGLIGTVIGFIMVAAEVDSESAADVGQVGSLVGALLHGMGVAFYTTLAGAVFSLWLSLNYQILHTGTANLLAALLDTRSVSAVKPAATTAAEPTATPAATPAA